MTIPNHGEPPQEVFIHFSMLEDEPAGMCWEGDRYPDATQRVTSNISEVTCAECKKHIKTLHDLNRAVAPVETPNDSFAQSFDALDWAKAFVARVKANPAIATDEGTMHGWFANAIMRGYDEHARKSNLAPVQTRLTAEQLVLDWWKQNNREAIQYTSLVEMCEAFRDKSGAELREEIKFADKARLHYVTENAGLREEIERLKEGEKSEREFLERDYGVSEITTICSRYDDAEQELTELREKLTEQEQSPQSWALCASRYLKRAEAAEAEAAALRERERLREGN